MFVDQLLSHLSPIPILVTTVLSTLILTVVTGFQAYSSLRDRAPLLTLTMTLCITCITISFLVATLVTKDRVFGIVAHVAGLMSYVFGVLSVVLMYRPKLRKVWIIGLTAFCTIGILAVPGLLGLRAFTWSVHIAMLLTGGILVLRSTDSAAPRLRIIIGCLMIVMAIAMTPTWFSVVMVFFANATNAEDTALAYNSAIYATRAFIWAVSPILTYSLINAVINARTQSELFKFAYEDSLTGLKSRRALFEFGPKEIQNRRNVNGESAVMVIDMDYFKRVNDQLGHLAGDAALLHVTGILRRALRDTDHYAARFGGEEFCVLLKNCQPASATIVAERIRRSVESNPFVYGDQEIPLTVSVGVSLASQVNQGQSAHGIADLAMSIKQADKHLYLAKKAGRNRVVSSEAEAPS